MELTISKQNADDVLRATLSEGIESCAVLFASRATLAPKGVRFIVRRVEIPTAEQYSYRGVSKAELVPAYVADISKRALGKRESLIFVHSHPGDDRPKFSDLDDIGERQLAGFLAIRSPGTPHGSVVISAGGWRGRILGSSSPMRIVALGDRREVLFDSGHPDQDPLSVFDRQVRAFGESGQRIIRSLKVAIVGLGGTGSVVAEQLAYLGVRNFLLVDPDKVELSNLNRVVGATKGDIGRNKVDVAKTHITTISEDACVRGIPSDVTRTKSARELSASDFIFSCTDSHGSRAVIQQISYQYLIPCIDIGAVITTAEKRITGIHGRIQALLPGFPCFTCCGLLDSEQVRRDLMSEAERKNDSYIQGSQEPAPAVISINSAVASLSVTMFMAITAGVPSKPRYLLYDATRQSLRAVSATANPNCYICSAHGVFGRGDLQTLFTRDD